MSSAIGAASKRAWGSAPRFVDCRRASAESAIHFFKGQSADPVGRAVLCTPPSGFGTGAHSVKHSTVPVRGEIKIRARIDRETIDLFRHRNVLFTIKNSRGSKKRNMRKRLRKISQLSS